MIRLFIMSIMFWSCTGNSIQEIKGNSINYEKSVTEVQNSDLLNGIQDKILKAFAQSMMTQDVKLITELDADLEKLYETKKNNLVVYWRSYLKFYESIYYTGSGDKKNAEKACVKGIDLLDKLENKNAEDYALLAMLRGFSFQFYSGMKAPFIAKKVEADLQAALALDSTNIRVNFVVANNDFYTPEKYGLEPDEEVV